MSLPLGFPLSDIPIEAPPPGIMPNFINPETRAPIVIAITAICLALIWPAFGLRVYSKAYVSKSFGWDDGMSDYRQACT